MTAACIIAFAAADARAQFACSTSGTVQTCINTGTEVSTFSNIFTGAVTENSGAASNFNAQSTSGEAVARNSGTANALFSASTGGGNVTTVNSGTAGTSNAFTSGGGNATNNNSGTLTSGNMGASTSGGFGHATALNSGTIANGNLVVATGSGGDAMVTNTASGVINGFAVAEAQAGGNGTLINAGSILGGEASARAFAGSASLTNSGWINVTGNVFTFSGSGSGALTNTGTISAERIRSLTGGGDATVNNAGTMVGRVEMQLTSGGNALLTNTGSISSSSATAVTMSATAGFSTSIVNAGTISGVTGVSSSGVMFINNPGVITGTGGTAINTAGNLALTLGTGSVLNGNVQAGGTTNSLNLAGQGTEDSSLTGFQTISLNGGDWVLTGAVTSAGGTTVTGTGQLTISGVLGGGALTKTGPGTLILSGNNTFTGATIVDGGTLLVNGSQASAVTVNGGALLGGSGTIGGLSVGIGGTVAPGNSIGTINVTGNVSFAAQSVYVVELNPQGQADRIVATGTATISGGTVQVQAETGFYRKDTRYTILTAASGVIGTFTTLTTNFAFLDLSLVYDANNVFLNVNRNSVQFAQLAHTENQLAVGKALDVFALNPPSADATTVSNALFNLSEPQARAAYDQISGAAHGNMIMSSLTMRRMFGRALDDRLMQEQGSAAARASAAQPGNAQFALAGTAGQDFAPLLAAASVTDDAAGRDTRSGWHTWVKGLGQFNGTSGDSNAQGYDLTIGGALLGADIMPLKGLRVGAAVGYAHGDFDGDDNSGSGGIDSYQGLVYGRYDHGKFFFADAQAGYAFNQYDLDRGIAFSTINRTASSDADGHDVSAQLRIGAKLDSAGFNIVPSASLRYDRLQRGDFTETGADSLNLSVESKSFTALRSSLGARASYPLQLAESGIELEPYAAAYWQHDFRNGAVPVEARFSGIGIDVHGTEVGRDAAVLQIGAAAVLDEQFSLFAGYDAELRVRQTDHAISAGMRYRW